jgi:hypothetical protein
MEKCNGHQISLLFSTYFTLMKYLASTQRIRTEMHVRFRVKSMYANGRAKQNLIDYLQGYTDP